METSRRSGAGFYQTLAYTRTGMPAKQNAGDHQAGPHERNKSLEREWLYDKAYNLTAIADSLRGSMFNTITANDQISHATWTGDSSQFPLCEELFTYDKNLNITRRQTRVNDILESETHQQNRHGRVISSEHEGWRHSTHRINPQTGKPEEGKFVRVVNAHNITWKYDVNGRLVQKLVDKGGYRPLEWRYRWDARSQLTGLETPDGERWEYKYDPFGRRISKRCTNRDKPGMDFHWNGDQLTEEIPVGVNGKPEDENAIRWIYEPGDFTPFARYEKGQLNYAVTDTVGRVQELLTEDGLIVWKGKQQLWGREEGINKGDAPTCRLRFPGQYEDTESGLYYNRFRYYDCETGQYISSDPIGLLGGINPYGYVRNSLELIDPWGLDSKRARLLKQKGFQEHHIISDKNSLTKNHPLLKAAAYDLQKMKNKIFLPTKCELHATRSIHKGRHQKKVSENLANEMDKVLEHGRKHGWTQKQYSDALDEIVAKERALLKSGHRALNKNRRAWSVLLT
ncbi:AHH domain-containing protein [Escherichia coli]